MFIPNFMSPPEMTPQKINTFKHIRRDTKTTHKKIGHEINNTLQKTLAFDKRVDSQGKILFLTLSSRN